MTRWTAPRSRSPSRGPPTCCEQRPNSRRSDVMGPIGVFLLASLYRSGSTDPLIASCFVRVSRRRRASKKSALADASGMQKGQRPCQIHLSLRSWRAPYYPGGIGDRPERVYSRPRRRSVQARRAARNAHQNSASAERKSRASVQVCLCFRLKSHSGIGGMDAYLQSYRSLRSCCHTISF